MNTLLLYIQVRKSPMEVRYQNPLHQIIYQEGLSADFVTYDIDNYSESLILNQLKVAISNATEIFVLVDAESGANLGGVGNIISILADQSSKVRIRLEGSHTILEKYLSVFSHQKSVVNTHGMKKIETILDKIYPK